LCGINGIITLDDHIQERLLNAEMVQRHRGPDSQGIIINHQGRWVVGLGHQRLSILDLSSAGNQPMALRDENGWIVYNGEVYNFREIQAELITLGRRFRSGTDTEVVLAALQTWDIEDALARFNGMWAFAWLDRIRNRLVLSRDRFGIKPLYYFLGKKEICFASEIKGVLAMMKSRVSLNYAIIGEYLMQSLLETTDETFFGSIKKIPAAHYAVIDLGGENLSLDFRRFWSMTFTDQQNRSEEELSEEIRETFIDAVRLRLRSDVPVGVLLSGGVDSSSIASAMQTVLGKDNHLNLLSAISKDPGFDEMPFINKMADYLGSDVNTVILDFDSDQAFALLEQVCWFNDEPVGSFSNVAHFLLMKHAKELNITVILCGQGADELLCGYKKYLGFYLYQLLREGRYAKAFRVYMGFHQQETILNQFTMGEAKRYLPSFLRPRENDIRGPNLKYFIPLAVGMQGCKSLMDRQRLDIERFSVPILVHYEDRMSMAWSREIRVPFLDYRLVEMLAPLDTERKLSNGWTKYIFRKAMEGMLPREIAWRKDKQGFVNPQSEWLKNDLKDGVRRYFGPDSLISRFGLVNVRELQKKYEMYCRQRPRRGIVSFKDIFNPLALEIWLRKYERYIVA
jgi:asparagine synthase (glutamine-hydrolysing)